MFLVGPNEAGGWGGHSAIREDEKRWREVREVWRFGWDRGKPEWRKGGESGRWSAGLNCQPGLWLGGADATMWEMNFMPVDSAISPGMWGFTAELLRRRTNAALCALTHRDRGVKGGGGGKECKQGLITCKKLVLYSPPWISSVLRCKNVQQLLQYHNLLLSCPFNDLSINYSKHVRRQVINHIIIDMGPTIKCNIGYTTQHIALLEVWSQVCWAVLSQGNWWSLTPQKSRFLLLYPHGRSGYTTSSTINQRTSDKHSRVSSGMRQFGLKGWVWGKDEERYVSLSVGTAESYVHFSPSWLPMWAHVFHPCSECQRVVWHKQRAGCLRGEGVCMEMVCQALFTLASISCGDQLPTCCLTSSFPPGVPPPPCSLSLSLSRAKVERTLQDFSCQMSSGDAGQVDSSSWEYTLQSPGLFAPELSNYCFFSMKSTIMSKKHPNRRHSSLWFSERN